MRASPDVESALYWQKIMFPFGFAIFIFYYHFVLVYTHASKTRSAWLAYLLLIVTSILSLRGLVVSNITLESYGYLPHYHYLMLILSGVGFIFLILSLLNLIKALRQNTRYEERNRLVYMIFSIAILVIVGGLDFFPSVPPIGIFGNILFCSITAVAITKYHLLDIQIVVKKGIIYLLISAIIGVPYVAAIVLTYYALKPRIELWWVNILLILILAIALRPVYSRVQHFMDKLFYRDRYDYLRALQHFVQEAQSITNIQKLCSKLVELIAGALQTRSICLLLPSESGHGLVVASSIGLENPPSGIVIRPSSSIFKWLQLHVNTLSSEQIDITPQLQSITASQNKIIEQMAPKLYVAIKTGEDQLTGILVAGEKLSQQSYTEEDRRLLTTLSTQMAMALENARLYSKSQQEVTERKLAEDALRESEERWYSIFDQSPIAIGLATPDGKSLTANRALQALTGYSNRELKKVNLFDIYENPEDRKRWLNILHQKGKVTNFTTRMKRKDGTPYDALLYASQIHFKGDDVLQITCIDITEHKRAEEKAREATTLRELDRLRTQLLANISHELRTPLASIKGFATMLIEYDKRLNQAEKREFLETIDKNTDRLSELIEQLLEMSRLESSMMKIDKKPTSIARIVQDAIAEAQITSPDHRFVLKITKKLPEVNVDSRRIRQVLDNLISNAVKYSHAGTEVTVDVQQVGHEIGVTVGDQGIGISEKDQARIFERMFRSQQRLIPGVIGIGLGLSICKGLVEAHGGRIWIESEEGKGTKCFFTLPIYIKKGIRSVKKA
jgi:PAS domain S-box-containing protein